MYAVALVELRTALDVEAAALGRDLSITAYEARLMLAQGAPAIVCTTPEESTAQELVSRVRERGHVAYAVDTTSVVPTHAMISMRRFVYEPAAIGLEDRPDELAYADIGALVAAVHRQHTTTETETQDRKLSLGRAVLTGGLVMTKTTTREARSETSEREPVLYVFPRSGAVPWLLRERGTLWTGHGAPVSPMASANFKVAVERLRERAPNAPYDDRLVSRRGVAERISAAASGHGSTTRSSVSTIDLFARVIALSKGVP